MSAQQAKQLKEISLAKKNRKFDLIAKDTASSPLPKFQRDQVFQERQLLTSQNCSSLIKFIQCKANEEQAQARFRFIGQNCKTSKKGSGKLNSSLPELKKDNLFYTKNLASQNEQLRVDQCKQILTENEEDLKTRKPLSNLRNSIDIEPTELKQNKQVKLKHFKHPSLIPLSNLNSSKGTKITKKQSHIVITSHNPNEAIFKPEKKLKIPLKSKIGLPLKIARTDNSRTKQKKKKSELKKIRQYSKDFLNAEHLQQANLYNL